MLSTVTTLAAETAEHGEPAIPPVFVGVIALGLLIVLLLAVVSFGGGREHS
ncbi:hypothetical protein J2X46_000097 [Nocardioides sp. BE266]|uniref:hypothetical protein n=1 Tax=Nocardioides sp. BE266 TaxID=2817725 RepID=UPI00285E521D|nr:hypothetical protein [Nocardioides sp. BE266]MDR7251125.1 hypothetical protein [Nocardioides sp. BE266]